MFSYFNFFLFFLYTELQRVFVDVWQRRIIVHAKVKAGHLMCPFKWILFRGIAWINGHLPVSLCWMRGGCVATTPFPSLCVQSLHRQIHIFPTTISVGIGTTTLSPQITNKVDNLVRTVAAVYVEIQQPNQWLSLYLYMHVYMGGGGAGIWTMTSKSIFVVYHCRWWWWCFGWNRYSNRIVFLLMAVSPSSCFG